MCGDRHLVNNGVCESPGEFVELRGRNVGFKNWHPTAVRGEQGAAGAAIGRCAAGGAWEWTSTVLARHEGFVEEEAYPEYTGEL